MLDGQSLLFGYPPCQILKRAGCQDAGDANDNCLRREGGASMSECRQGVVQGQSNPAEEDAECLCQCSR